jgi:serine/threonine protein kinase
VAVKLVFPLLHQQPLVTCNQSDTFQQNSSSTLHMSTRGELLRSRSFILSQKQPPPHIHTNTLQKLPLTSRKFNKFHPASLFIGVRMYLHKKWLQDSFFQEMRLLSKLRHPCITNVMGAVLLRNEDPLIVMELMHHGSLANLLHNDSILLEGQILLPILQDICQGLCFLHEADPQIFHSNLKTQNVLVDNSFRAKLCDFGPSQSERQKRENPARYIGRLQINSPMQQAI